MKDQDRTFAVIGCTAILFWLFSVLFGLATTAGIIYIVVHFAMKFW